MARLPSFTQLFTSSLVLYTQAAAKATATPSSSAQILPSEISRFVPPCARECFLSFLQVNYGVQEGHPLPSLQSICAHVGATGLLPGEGALQCIVAEASFKVCTSNASNESARRMAYNMCSSQPHALTPTRKAVTATLMMPTSGGIVRIAPLSASKTGSSSVPVPTTLLTLTSAASITTESASKSSSSQTRPLSSPTSTAATTTATSTLVATPTPSTGGTSGHKRSMSQGQIAGLSVGLLAAAGCFGGALFLLVRACGRRRKRSSSTFGFNSGSVSGSGFAPLRDSWGYKVEKSPEVGMSGRRMSSWFRPSGGGGVASPTRSPGFPGIRYFHEPSLRLSAPGLAGEPGFQVIVPPRSRPASRLLPARPNLEAGDAKTTVSRLGDRQIYGDSTHLAPPVIPERAQVRDNASWQEKQLGESPPRGQPIWNDSATDKDLELLAPLISVQSSSARKDLASSQLQVPQQKGQAPPTIPPTVLPSELPTVPTPVPAPAPAPVPASVPPQTRRHISERQSTETYFDLETEEAAPVSPSAGQVWRPPSGVPTATSPFYVADEHGNWVLGDRKKAEESSTDTERVDFGSKAGQEQVQADTYQSQPPLSHSESTNNVKNPNTPTPSPLKVKKASTTRLGLPAVAHTPIWRPPVRQASGSESKRQAPPQSQPPQASATRARVPSTASATTTIASSYYQDDDDEKADLAPPAIQPMAAPNGLSPVAESPLRDPFANYNQNSSSHKRSESSSQSWRQPPPYARELDVDLKSTGSPTLRVVRPSFGSQSYVNLDDRSALPSSYTSSSPLSPTYPRSMNSSAHPRQRARHPPSLRYAPQRPQQPRYPAGSPYTSSSNRDGPPSTIRPVHVSSTFPQPRPLSGQRYPVMPSPSSRQNMPSQLPQMARGGGMVPGQRAPTPSSSQPYPSSHSRGPARPGSHPYQAQRQNSSSNTVPQNHSNSSRSTTFESSLSSSSSSSLLAKRLGTERAATMALDTPTQQQEGASSQQPGSSSSGRWQRENQPGQQQQHVAFMQTKRDRQGSGYDMPLSPDGQRMTPTRRGDDLYLHVG